MSLCLILALVLTAFGIFTSFAEGSAPDEAPFHDQGKIVYDMDSLSKISIDKKTNGPNLVRDKNGHWEMNIEGRDPVTAATDGDYWQIESSSPIYINNKYTVDETTGEKKVSTAKNTDYFIIDFDISTNSSLLDGIYFHNRWYNNTGGNAQQNYVQLNGTDLDNFYISTYQGGTVIRPAMTPDEWLNVTIVYDFSSVDEDGYAVTADWKIHVYLDGIWCGNLPSISTSAVSYAWNRVSTDSGAIQLGPDASTVFANFTYKTFPRGYEGPLTEAGVLGLPGATLMDIPELQYTQENTPYSPDKLIATIERAGEEIEVYKYDEINASLEDGDVVILERSISTPFIKDSNATVTFKDKNGTVLTPGTYNEGDLVYVEKPTEIDFTSGSVIRVFYDNPRKKNVTDSSKFFSYSVLDSYAPAGESGSARFYDYILLDDATYAATATAGLYGDILETDLNGHTLTLSHTKRMFDSSGNKSTDTKSSYMRFAFRNGTLINAGAELTSQGARTTVIFEDLTLSHEGSNPFDDRGGVIIYNNVKGTSNHALADLKGGGTVRTAMIVEDSDITVSGDAVFYVSNISSSSLRQGSLHVSIRAINSKLSAATKSSLVYAEIYGNATGTYSEDAGKGTGTFTHKNEYYAKNDNDIKVVIDGCDVSAPTSTLIYTNVVEFLAKKSTSVYVDANEQFSLDLDCCITGSKASAKYLYNQLASSYKDTLQYKDNYTYDARIEIDNTDLHMALEDGALVSRGSALPSTSLDLTFGAEVSAPAIDETKYLALGSNASADNYTFTYAEKCTWVKRSLEGAPAYTYTNNLDTHAYIYDGHEYEFIAYLGDPVNSSNIPQALPEESELLAFEWIRNIDGAWEAVVTYKGSLKANVTAASDLALNVYLPATFGDEAYKSVYVEGYKVDVTDVIHEGVAYKAVTIPGIDPTSATKDFTIRFRAVDENGSEATIECEISVLDYIESALKSDTVTAEGKQLVASLLNYIAKTAKYNNPASELDPALRALLESEEYGEIILPAPAVSEAKATVGQLGVFSSARLVLDTRFAYELLVKDGFSGEITLSYLSGGVTKTETLTVAGGDIVRVELLAYEVGTPISITYGEAVGELNLAGYVSLISEPAAELTALAEAIAIYEAAAVAYMQ